MVQATEQKEYTQFERVPMFGGLEMLRARYQHMRFPKHIHETYCISVIEEGVQHFYRTGAEHILAGLLGMLAAVLVARWQRNRR